LVSINSANEDAGGFRLPWTGKEGEEQLGNYDQFMKKLTDCSTKIKEMGDTASTQQPMWEQLGSVINRSIGE